MALWDSLKDWLLGELDSSDGQAVAERTRAAPTGDESQPSVAIEAESEIGPSADQEEPVPPWWCPEGPLVTEPPKTARPA